MNARFAALAITPLLLLAACGDNAATEEAEDNRQASGEILEGSISDAMLPLDEVRSQAPLAGPAPVANGDVSAPDSEAAQDAALPEAPSAEAGGVEEPAPAVPAE